MASFSIPAGSAKGRASVRPSAETDDQRTARLEKFFSDAKNRVIYSVGKLLSFPADAQGNSAASIIALGGSVPVENLEVAGTSLPLPEGFTISLSTIKTWGCLSCGSAQGSGVYPSKAVNAKLLAENDFYYNPASQELFTISPTCWTDRIKGAGRAKYFTEVPTPQKGKK